MVLALSALDVTRPAGVERRRGGRQGLRPARCAGEQRRIRNIGSIGGYEPSRHPRRPDRNESVRGHQCHKGGHSARVGTAIRTYHSVFIRWRTRKAMGRAAYSAAKCGVEGFSEVLAKETALLGIKGHDCRTGRFSQPTSLACSTKLNEGRPEYAATVGAGGQVPAPLRWEPARRSRQSCRCAHHPGWPQWISRPCGFSGE